MSSSATTLFRKRRGGLIFIGGNYGNNEQSVYVNCGTIISQNGFNINGGKIINTGIFTVGEILICPEAAAKFTILDFYLYGKYE